MTKPGTAQSPAVESAPTERMQCMEVYGGNHFTESAIGLSGLDCWIYSKPHGGAPSGGDVFYASSCATGRIVRLMLADIAGHGSSVASLAHDLRTLMRRFVNRLDQAEFVHLVNNQFAKSSPGAVFATAIVGTFFAPSRRLRLCNAGHPRPLLYRAATRQWGFFGGEGGALECEPGNLPLGIIEQIHFEQFDIELQPGDCVLAYTDALSESCDANGEMLCESGLLRILQLMGGDFQPAELVEALKTEIAQRHPSNLCEDDVTLLLLRANGLEAVYPLGERLRAVWRFLKALIGSVDPRKERPPFPDLMLANIGGAIIPALGRRWRAPPKLRSS
jgi:hypothetical protein